MGQLYSMTGFGHVEADAPDGRIEVELRSVNHRYLDLQIRLPEGFRSLEPELRRLVSQRIKRGKVDATVSFEAHAGERGGPRLNLEHARAIIAQTEAVADEMREPDRVSPLALLRMPGVLEDRPIDIETNLPATIQALDDAVDRLRTARATEGDKVKSMLTDRCADIERTVAVVRARLPDVLDEIRKRLTQRVESLTAQADPERLEQELAIIAQKLDVAEELDRLEAHCTEVRATVDADEPVGRRLDFLMQELNREANTLASKSADTETTQCAVDLKVLIEQMREQVQNVE